MYPGRHAHEGEWLIILHSAYAPHIPGHGSRHLLFMQALSLGHSLFNTHSGLHPVYGSPVYSGIHEQDPALFLSLQIAFAPHGDGLQGSFGTSAGGATIKYGKIHDAICVFIHMYVYYNINNIIIYISINNIYCVSRIYNKNIITNLTSQNNHAHTIYILYYNSYLESVSVYML